MDFCEATDIWNELWGCLKGNGKGGDVFIFVEMIKKHGKAKIVEAVSLLSQSREGQQKNHQYVLDAVSRIEVVKKI